MLTRIFCLNTILVLATPLIVGAEESEHETFVREAISRAIPLLEKASAGSADHRTCFTCHNQALPILALAEARKRNFVVDEKNFTRQVQHTYDHLERGKNNYLNGKGQGGKVVTAGYALWALHAGGQSPNEVTSAVVEFLLTYQSKSDHWSQPSKRPPTSGSDFMTSYVALRGLSVFGNQDQHDRIAARTEAVAKWVESAAASDTEDQVFQLRLLHHVGAGQEAVDGKVAALLDAQRASGGWSQKPEMAADAYATATVLAVLLETQSVSATASATQQATRYLVDSQLDDGSWHVVTRADGFQEYYESGFPHDENQFISVAASSWAALALLLTLP